MKKRIISTVLLFCIFLSMLSVMAMADLSEVLDFGTCGAQGDNLTWVLNEDGTLTISGSGDMYDYYNSTIPGYQYASKITKVIIEEGVTSIGSSAFYNCSSLRSITIPDSVTSIGFHAFYNCSSLNSITIPDSVTSIGDGAFSWCSNLSSITIPDSVRSIGAYAFYNCSELKTIYIENLKNFCEIDFYDSGSPMEYVSEIYVNGELVTELVIPEGTTKIGDAAFFNCDAIEAVTIPPSVTSIGENAFYWCYNLQRIEIPTSVISIGADAFACAYDLSEVYYYCGTPEQWDAILIGSGNDKLTSARREYHKWGEGTIIKRPTEDNDGVIAFPCTSCDETKTGVFTGQTVIASGMCRNNLIWVVTDDGTLTISGDGNMMDFSRNSTEAWHKYKDDIFYVEVNPGVTSIGNYAFFGLANMKSIVLPDGLTSIGERAFENCTGLSSIKFPSSISYIDGSAFAWCDGLKTVYIENIRNLCEIDFNSYGSPMEHASEVYINGELTTDLVIPEGTTKIGSYVFNGCDALEAVTIPPSVTSIGENAFSSCSNLRKVKIPTSVTSIGTSAFLGSSKLSEVYYYCGTPEQWNAILMNVGNNNLSSAKREYHMWDEGQVTKKPTVSAEGIKTFKCIACGDTKTEPIAKLDSETVENPFNDVAEKDFFYEPVMWAVSKNVTSGLSADTFGATKGCTRAQVVTFLWRAAGEPAPTSDVNPFTDVKQGQYYYDAVLWAVENGITTGLNATTFGTNADCNRGQIVTFLWRAMGKPAPTNTSNPFKDVSAKQYYYDAVLWAVENGITTGLSATSFGPNSTCTRGQIVTFLYRAYK